LNNNLTFFRPHTRYLSLGVLTGRLPSLDTLTHTLSEGSCPLPQIS